MTSPPGDEGAVRRLSLSVGVLFMPLRTGRRRAHSPRSVAGRLRSVVARLGPRRGARPGWRSEGDLVVPVIGAAVTGVNRIQRFPVCPRKVSMTWPPALSTPSVGAVPGAPRQVHELDLALVSVPGLAGVWIQNGGSGWRTLNQYRGRPLASPWLAGRQRRQPETAWGERRLTSREGVRGGA